MTDQRTRIFAQGVRLRTCKVVATSPEGCRKALGLAAVIVTRITQRADRGVWRHHNFQSTGAPPADDRDVGFCAGFWTPAWRTLPRAVAAGVQKAPRHEVAGSWGPAVQRALWGFDGGAGLGGGCDAERMRAADLHTGEFG